MGARSCLAAVSLLAPGAAWAVRAPGRPPLADRTLVAWVRLANTRQRGVAALTVQEGEDFDSLVLGERAPGRWMAGSDFFRRTQPEAEQAALPAETETGRPVAIASVYDGKSISLYRDGRLYAAHAIAQPRTYAGAWKALIGLRYAGALGETGFLAGEVAEARIYDRALSPAQVAGLVPGQRGEVAPMAWWTFDRPTPRDRMGRFRRCELLGGAVIRGGRLMLNGRDACMTAESGKTKRTPAPPLFYRPARTGNMWDTWLYRENGVTYVYHLSGPPGQWNAVALARSADGVRWREVGRVLDAAPDVAWLGTGSVWKRADLAQSGRYVMNFSEWRGPSGTVGRQSIFFAESKDLLHWERLPPDTEFRQDERWYARDGRWDCIWTLDRPGGGFYGYWTATPLSGRGVGFGESDDGVHWRALPPPALEGDLPTECMPEVGAIARVDGRLYMMVGLDGMTTLVGDAPQGPFRPAAHNRRLLVGNATYFSRFFPTAGGLLVNHHSWDPRSMAVSMAPIKRAVVDAAGTMRLTWWPANDRAKGRALVLRPTANEAAGSVTLLGPALGTEGTVIIEGRVDLSAAGGGPVGIYLPGDAASGTGWLIDGRGAADVGPMQANGAGFVSQSRVDRELAVGASARFRLVRSSVLCELYVDDALMQCWSVPTAGTGAVGLVGAPSRFHDLRAWRCR